MTDAMRSPYAIVVLRQVPIEGTLTYAALDEADARTFAEELFEKRGETAEILRVYPLSESPYEEAQYLMEEAQEDETTPPTTESIN